MSPQAASGLPDEVLNSAGLPYQVLNPAGLPDEVLNSAGLPYQVLNPAGLPDEVLNSAGLPYQVLNPADLPYQVLNPAGSPYQVLNPAESTKDEYQNNLEEKSQRKNTSENTVIAIDEKEQNNNSNPVLKKKQSQLNSDEHKDNILFDLRMNSRNLRSIDDDNYLKIESYTNLSLLTLLLQNYQFNYASQLLKNKKLDFDAIDNNGNHVLHYKFILQNRDILDFLISYKVKINVQNNDGQTPLIICCKYLDLADSAKYLIDLDADINILDNSGANALFYACQLPLVTYQDFKIALNLVEKLLEKGADPNIITNDIKNCLSVSSTDMISKVLKDNGAKKIKLINNIVEYVFNEVIAKNSSSRKVFFTKSEIKTQFITKKHL